MNCPFCSRLCEVTRENEGGGTTTYIRCPTCSERPPAPAWEMLTGRREIREYVNGATSPEQLAEQLDRTPDTAEALRFALSLLWVHHCVVMRMLIPSGGEPGVLCRIAELRHDLATQLRARAGEGGVT